MRIALYARKSKSTDQGESIENQFSLCYQYAQIHFPGATFEEFKDEGFSGSNLNRPAFKKLMSELNSSRFDALMCYRLDRISRNVLDFASTLDLLTKNNTSFISIKENFDTTTPMGRAMIQISCVFAELERSTIAERIRDNMLELAKTGRWLGGTPPIGYTTKRTTYTKNNHTKNYTLIELDPAHAPVASLIYNKYLELGSLSQLQTFLMQNNYKTLTNSYFTRTVLRGILTNPIYCVADQSIYDFFSIQGAFIANEKECFDGTHGLIAYNKHKAGKNHFRNDISEWIVAISEHIPLIDSTSWLTVQQILNANKDKAIPTRRSSIALLGGLLRCKHCGAPMSVMGHDILKDGSISYSYRCSLKISSKGSLCTMKNAKGHFLDSQLINFLSTLIQNKESFIAKFASTLEMNSTTSDLTSNAQNLKIELEKTQSKLSKFLDLLSEEDSPLLIQTYKIEIEKLKQHLNDIQKEYDDLQVQVNSHNTDHSFILNVISQIKNLIMNYNAKLPFKSSNLLKSLIHHISWDGCQVFVCFNGPTTYLKGSNRRYRTSSKITYEK